MGLKPEPERRIKGPLPSTTDTVVSIEIEIVVGVSIEIEIAIRYAQQTLAAKTDA
jgi:hypothetical protein